MIEPLLWTILCTIAIALCWVKIRTGGMFLAMVAVVFGYIYGQSGWTAFLALLDAMDAVSAGLEPKPFRVTILIAAPMIVTLAWPVLRDLFSHHGGRAHGSA